MKTINLKNAIKYILNVTQIKKNAKYIKSKVNAKYAFIQINNK